MQLKELAKFAAGVTAWETIIHIAMALGGVLPLTWFGITITSGFNTIQIIISGILTVLLIYYGWKPSERKTSAS